MHISLRAIASRVAPVVAAALVVATAQPVFADIPLPIIDVVPQQFFTTNGSSINQSATAPIAGTARSTTPPNDNLVIGGTFTEPLFRGLSISYDNIVGGAFDTALTSQSIPGVGTIYPGPAHDFLQNYRLDYHFGGFNFEGGFGTRHRNCCPFASLEWHKGYAGISYATPHFAFLNGGFFVLDVTGNAVHYAHNATDYLAEGYTPAQVTTLFPTSAQAYQLEYGAGIADNKEVYTSQQAITAIIPIDLKHGVRTATTFLWGALDYGVDSPFPNMYDVFIISATKQFTDNFGLTANVSNVTQREQGYPFPAPGAIHTTALAVAADFHLDLRKLIPAAPQPERGRSTQPGVPGGPGGPAPISPTQGGATSAPSPAPAMAQPAMSPAPAMSPGAMPAPSPTP